MSKSMMAMAFALTLGLLLSSCGGGGYSTEVADQFTSECELAWDEPFCACALNYFESNGDEAWFKSVTQNLDVSDPADWLSPGVDTFEIGFVLAECQDEFEG